MAYKAFKFRTYPTPAQEVLLAKTFGCTRFIYNQLLAAAIESYDTTKKFDFPTPATLKPTYPWLAEVDSLALCNAQLQLKTAFSNFLRDRKKKTNRKCGFPKFKNKKTTHKSYTTNLVNDNIRKEEGKLRLPKLGLLKVVFHRRVEGTALKSATVSQDPSGKYYVSLLVEYTPPKPHKWKPATARVVGLDFSFKHLVVTNTGTKVKYPRWLEEVEEKLAQEQRRLSRKQKGSNNKEKQRVKVARVYERLRNRRLDWLHKLVKTIVTKFDVVVVEDINLVAMAKKGPHRRFGKTLSSLSFGLFRTLLQQSCERLGKLFVVASRWYPSSQLCSACGFKNHEVKDLAVRSWECPCCGTMHDRDVNAAQNLVNWYHQYYVTGTPYQKQLPTLRGEVTLGERLPLRKTAQGRSCAQARHFLVEPRKVARPLIV